MSKNTFKPEEVLWDELLSNEHNQWLLDYPLVIRSLLELFSTIDLETAKKMNYAKGLIFLQSQGRMSCIVTPQGPCQIIILFPDLIKMLQSGAPRFGQAILAHELGHLIHRHSEKQMTMIEAQIEADFFAFQLGYHHELEELLQNHASTEAKVRLAFLTSHWAEKLRENL